MKTKKVYYDDVYMSNGTGNVLEILTSKEHSSAVSLVLDQTIFFPTGGGQSCDLGTINGLPVIDVREDKDAIYHVVDIGDKDVNNIFHVGDEVSLAIDWERRFDNMQRHCGEHILSGIFYKLFGGVNRGFHMGDDYLTIDISLEDKPEFKELSMDMCLEAELMANQAIWDNLPVVRKVFDSREEAVKMPLRKALAIDEDISIVTIGDENDPADSVACCGTHPAYAGQVGMIKIYKVEPNKGMFRIFFEAGKRALLAYDKQYDILTKLGNDLSAGVPDLMDKYNARNDKNKEIRDRLYNLTKEVLRRESDKISSMFEDAGSDAAIATTNSNAGIVVIPDTGAIRMEYSILTADDIIELGRSLSGKIPSMLYLIHKPSLTVFLFSENHDCGKLVKENATVFGGKGGGNKTFARAIFQRTDDLDSFIQAVNMLTKQS